LRTERKRQKHTRGAAARCGSIFRDAFEADAERLVPSGQLFGEDCAQLVLHSGGRFEAVRKGVGVGQGVDIDRLDGRNSNRPDAGDVAALSPACGETSTVESSASFRPNESRAVFFIEEQHEVRMGPDPNVLDVLPGRIWPCKSEPQFYNLECENWPPALEVAGRFPPSSRADSRV